MPDVFNPPNAISEASLTCVSGSLYGQITQMQTQWAAQMAALTQQLVIMSGTLQGQLKLKRDKDV